MFLPDPVRLPRHTTFEVGTDEVANILNNANDRSLIGHPRRSESARERSQLAPECDRARGLEFPALRGKE
jgi:hypothetical protein